jgi:hypothetical protein
MSPHDDVPGTYCPLFVDFEEHSERFELLISYICLYLQVCTYHFVRD